MKKKLKFTIELKPRTRFQRLCRYIVDLIIDRGWAGETVLPNEFISTWTSAESKRIPEQLKAKLNAALKRERNMVRKHFKTDGYDLNLDFIRHDVIRDMAGFNIYDYITSQLVKGLPVDEVIRIDGPKLVKRAKR